MIHSKRQRVWLHDWKLLCCGILVVLGVLFRFGNLHQVYWHDETYTSLRMSGYQAAEVREQHFNGQFSTMGDLMQYQWPNEMRTIGDTVRSLAREDPQHPPVYYILVRQWVETFGKSIWITRSFSVFVSLLAFPAMYWLCQELFASSNPIAEVDRSPRRLTGAMAMAVLALSPFHILYAQEAREYALWTVMTLVTSAAFLRALRCNTHLNWILYTASLTISLYTHPFSALSALGYGAYAIGVEGFRLTRRLLAALLASAVAGVLFLPWLLVMLSDEALRGTSWTSQPIPLPLLLQLWGLHVARTFILVQGDFGFDTGQVYLTLPFLLALIGYSLYFVGRHTAFRFGFFIVLLIGSSFLPLALPDLILGGQRSTAGRYLVPAILGVQLAIAVLLAAHIQQVNLWKRRFWQGVTAIVMVVGIGAGMDILQAETSWIKVFNHNLPALSPVVRGSSAPLLIGVANGINLGTLFALGYSLDPGVQLLLFNPSPNQVKFDIPVLPKEVTDVFLLNPPEMLRQQIEQRKNSTTSLVFKDFHLSLWKLVP